MNKIAMDTIKQQKQVPKSSIEKIGAMESVKDFSSLMVNTITIPTALFYHKELEHLGPQSVLRQVAHKFALLVNSAEWT